MEKSIQSIKNLRWSYHRAILKGIFWGFALLLLLRLSPGAFASPINYDGGRTSFDTNSIQIPDAFLRQNSLYNYLEWKRGEDLIFLHAYLSQRGKNHFNLESPLLIYKNPWYDIILGSQVTGDATQFENKIPFVGARAAYYTENGAFTIYKGASGQANDWVNFSPGLKDYEILGAAAKYQVNSRNALALYAMRFHNQGPGRPYSKTLGLSLGTKPMSNLEGGVSFARDFAVNDDNEFGEWNFNYNLNSGRTVLGGNGRRQESRFGPDIDFNFATAQSSSVFHLNHNFSGNFVTRLQYYKYDFGSTFLSSNSSSNQSASIDNQWKVDPRTTLRLGARRDDYSLISPTGTVARNRLQWTAGVDRKITDRIDLLAQYVKSVERNDSIAQVINSRSITTGLGYNFSKNHAAQFLYDRYVIENPGTRNVSNNLGLRYKYLFPHDRGSLLVDYRTQENSIPELNIFDRTKVGYASLQYFPSRRWNYAFSYNSYMPEGDRQSYSSFSTSVEYVINKHSTMRASYQSNPYSLIRYIQDQPFELKNILSLELRHSFGGPLQENLTGRLNGDITCQLSYFPVNRPNDVKPLTPEMPRVPLILTGDRIGSINAKTDENGRAVFQNLPPGSYSVKIDREGLTQNLKDTGLTEKYVQMTAGRTATANFTFQAVSSAYVVVWSDFKDVKQLTSPYAGFEGIKVVLDGQHTGVSDANGVVIFSNLQPGTHTVTLDESTIPKGLVFTTDKAITANVLPGVENLITFGLQGWGILRGKVTVISTGKTIPEPAEGVPIRVGGEEKARSDKAGEYSVRIPAGTHKVEPFLLTYSSNAYFVNPPPDSTKLDPDQEISADFLLAYYSSISGKLMERVGGKVVPMKKSGLVINFSQDPGYVYTDRQGEFTLSRLPIGTYQVSLDKAYVPKGYRLVSPAEVTVKTLSGARERVEFVLEKI
jgi:hypothetical protein